MKTSKLKVVFIWDFDGAIGQLNASFPYNFSIYPIWEELENVLDILTVLKRYDIKATFAITGFCAEETVEPFDSRAIIREIANGGHEIASHSWRHEWFPKVTNRQAMKSLERSKIVLEQASSLPVVGFVPPHNRPMTWIQRGRLSLGDMRIFPFQKTGDVRGVISFLRELSYKWIRVSGRSFLSNFFGGDSVFNHNLLLSNGILVLDGHYTGFDEKLRQYVHAAESGFLCITGHPLMWSRKGKRENKREFDKLLTEMLVRRDKGSLTFFRPSDLVTD